MTGTGGTCTLFSWRVHSPGVNFSLWLAAGPGAFAHLKHGFAFATGVLHGDGLRAVGFRTRLFARLLRGLVVLNIKRSPWCLFGF